MFIYCTIYSVIKTNVLNTLWLVRVFDLHFSSFHTATNNYLGTILQKRLVMYICIQFILYYLHYFAPHIKCLMPLSRSGMDSEINIALRIFDMHSPSNIMKD